jgi:alkylhydroperoxidase family enzyme
MTDEQMQHLTDDPLPAGVYSDAQAAIIRYAQKSTVLKPIDDDTYAALEAHFSRQQIIDLCLTVGMSNVINRFHATFQTDVDEATLAEVAAGNQGESPITLPRTPGTTS